MCSITHLKRRPQQIRFLLSRSRAEASSALSLLLLALSVGKPEQTHKGKVLLTSFRLLRNAYDEQDWVLLLGAHLWAAALTAQLCEANFEPINPSAASTLTQSPQKHSSRRMWCNAGAALSGSLQRQGSSTSPSRGHAALTPPWPLPGGFVTPGGLWEGRRAAWRGWARKAHTAGKAGQASPQHSWAHRTHLTQHHVAGGDHPAVARGGVRCGWQGVGGSPEGLHCCPEPTGQNLLQHWLHPPRPGAAGRGRGGKAQLPVLQGGVAQFSLQMFPSRSFCPAPCRRSLRASAVTSTWLWPTSSGEPSSTRDTSECMASALRFYPSFSCWQPWAVWGARDSALR